MKWLCEMLDVEGTPIGKETIEAPTWHEARLEAALMFGYDDFDREIRCTPMRARSVTSKRGSR